MIAPPVTIAERLVALDARRTLRLGAVQGADGRVVVVVQLVTPERRELLCSLALGRLRAVGQAIAALASELGVQP